MHELESILENFVIQTYTSAYEDVVFFDLRNGFGQEAQLRVSYKDFTEQVVSMLHTYNLSASSILANIIWTRGDNIQVTLTKNKDEEFTKEMKELTTYFRGEYVVKSNII